MEESSEEADVSMAELDRRRSEAKKKAAKGEFISRGFNDVMLIDACDFASTSHFC